MPKSPVLLTNMSEHLLSATLVALPPFSLLILFHLWFSVVVGLAGQEEHWKAGHQLECKEITFHSEKGGGSDEDEGSAKPSL